MQGTGPSSWPSYNATDGPNWGNNNNWLSDKPLDTWHGVTTDHNGRVIVLSLPKNRLNGEIPTELGTLFSLRELDLTGNHLIGSMPYQFGELSNVERLLLSDNQLSGEIPRSLTELSALTRFYFEANAGLCVPADDAFQAWAEQDRRQSGRHLSEGPDPGPRSIPFSNDHTPAHRHLRARAPGRRLRHRGLRRLLCEAWRFGHCGSWRHGVDGASVARPDGLCSRSPAM